MGVAWIARPDPLMIVAARQPGRAMARSASRLPFVNAWSLALALALSAAGCVSPHGPAPAQILVRNSSGADVEYVWLQEVPAEGASTVRMGMVSPLPRGATQIVDRHASAPPLPAEVELSWLPSRGANRTQRLSLAPLADAPDVGRRALVFELLPDGSFRVSVEPRVER